MYMSKMSRNMRAFNVSVVGVSGTEKEKGHSGVGKSCLCNRFVRAEADEYNVEHISVLSQMDFSSRVINNDHFLYWGEVLKNSEDGEFLFSVVEQTEFIDDASFQAFKGGKMEPYMKRCSATKLASAEKLMYICKNQLGIEKEYEQKVLPDGRFSVDGFICVFDVSTVPSRSIEKQVEFLAGVLNNILKTKKPVVLVTTKNDEANEVYVKEAERLVQRKEFKGTILLVETSAHENINVDQAFIVLAQLIDRTKGRPKISPFGEASRMRKEQLDIATEAFQRLVRNQVQDFHCVWSHTAKKLSGHPDFKEYVGLLGLDSAQRQFRRHVKRLKDEQLAARLNNYMDLLPEVLQEMVPDLNTLHDGLIKMDLDPSWVKIDWPLVQQHIKEHIDFNQYFFECPEDMSWMELDETQDEGRIPFDVLDTIEAETVFKNHLNALQQEQKRLELPRRWRKQFKQLLEETGYVTPGKMLAEVRVLFMGRECFEALSEQDCQQIYDQHQKEIIDKAKHNFQELLLEHADLFYHFKSIAPSGTITQEDIKDITDALQEDSRYKALDRLDQDRKLMLFQHLGFVHCPIREHCPAFPNCMDALIERILATKAHRPSSWNRSSQWLLSADSNKLNLVLLGIDGLAEELATEIRAQCEDDEYEFECQTYGLDYRIIDGDVSLPQNSFRTSDFLPHGCFCVYSNPESFEYVRDSLEKTLLSNLEQEDRLPFQGLPIVILFSCDPSVDEKEAMNLREEGQSLADSLQCPFIDVSVDESVSGGDCQRFNSVLISDALRQLVQSIQHRAGFLNIYQSVVDYSEPDIRIILCVFCGDPYSVENVLSPLLSHQCCFLSGDRSIILETFLGDSKRKVEVIISSFHGANAFREELVHGFVLVYSTKRKASLATLDAFSANIPNLPIQILAVTDSGGANAFFSNDLSHQLITGGNMVADRLGAHFMTSAASIQQKTAFFTPFFKEVWDKKPEIEQAFNMEEPSHLDDSGEGTLERSSGRHHHPRPPPRHESYHIKASNSNDGSGSEIYERLPTDGSMGDELDDQLSPNFPDDQGLSASDDSEYSGVELYHQENGEHHLVKPSDLKNRRKLHHGFEVYPPPTTPPEPAPPDHPPQRSRLPKASASLPTGSHSSLEEITSDISGSRESLATRGDSDKEDNEMWVNSYGLHAFTTGRRHLPTKSTRPKGNSQTLKQPGKLNMKDFSHVTDVLSRMTVVAAKDGRRNAPLATSEEFDQVKDALQGGFQYDGEFSYLGQDTMSGTNKTRIRQRRDKGHRQAYTDSDSDWSSLERRKLAAEMYRGGSGGGGGGGGGGVGRKSTPHKRTRKKRAAIPVATPRVPPFGDAAAAMLSYRFKEDKVSESGTDESDEEPRVPPPRPHKHPLRRPVAPPVIPRHFAYHQSAGKYKMEGTYGGPEEEPSLDVSSPRDVNSPMDHHQAYLQGYMQPMDQFAVDPKKDEKTRRKEKQKAKEDEKRRLKEEKKLDKDRKKAAKGGGGKLPVKGPSLADFVQSKQNAVPLIIEKCVQFIESEGVESEGIYRVPGNRAHVELLFQKFEEDPNADLAVLDIPVNAVATALKDFFSKRLPPIFTEEAMGELENISVRTSDRSMRLLQLRELLTKKLPDENFQVLKFIFQHFVKVAENCKLNSMDSKNLAICWWPTLLPYEFNDMTKFEHMRPHLEDLVQTMIDQYPFLFCGKEAFVMV